MKVLAAMLSRPSNPNLRSCRPLTRSEEHTSELQSQSNLVCRLLLEKKKKNNKILKYANCGTRNKSYALCMQVVDQYIHPSDVSVHASYLVCTACCKL